MSWGEDAERAREERSEGCLALVSAEEGGRRLGEEPGSVVECDETGMESEGGV